MAYCCFAVVDFEARSAATAGASTAQRPGRRQPDDSVDEGAVVAGLVAPAVEAVADLRSEA